jgi:hypothetical protein
MIMRLSADRLADARHGHPRPSRVTHWKAMSVFCALGEGVRFIMNGANHRMDDPSTFPFPIMGGSWAEQFDLITGLPGRGDTVVCHDVWLGYRSLVMPGVRIGHGAIIASGSVVVDDVPDYGIVGGNPARLVRRRYSDADIDRLLAVAWWDWPLRHIGEHIRTIMSGGIDDLERAAPAVATSPPSTSKARLTAARAPSSSSTGDRPTEPARAAKEASSRTPGRENSPGSPVARWSASSRCSRWSTRCEITRPDLGSRSDLSHRRRAEQHGH